MDEPRIGVGGYSVLPTDPDIVKRAQAAYSHIDAVQRQVRRVESVDVLSRAFARLHGTLRAALMAVEATDEWLAKHELDLRSVDEIHEGDPIRTVVEARQMVSKLAIELGSVLRDNGDVVSWVSALRSAPSGGSKRGSNPSESDSP